ncbi:MATE family efflux transporter [Ruminococcus sp.]|uniref:MATE family efflux transporter n=1 Tax=Ruminococcus sp. TaxID=41978 RepID=UPI003863DD3A
MKRNGDLLNQKYNSLLWATLAMTASTYLSSILDGIMVGQILDTVALYAINLTTSIVFLRSIPIAMFTFGGNTLSVICKSKRDQKSADTVFTLSFWGGIVSTAVISVIGIILIMPTAQLLAQGKEELVEPVVRYLLPLWVLTPLVAAVNETAAFARTDGLRKLATALPIIANVINLICDYIYMAIFGWGIAGAGWATVTGYVVGALIALIYFKSPKRTVRFTKAAWGQLKQLGKIFSVGLPSALIYVCNFLRLFFVNAIILSSTGVVGGKIASVSFSLNSLAFILVEGASMTLLPILGALYGEKDSNGQRLTLRYGMIVTVALSIFVMILSVVFPSQLAALYGLTDPAVLEVFEVTFRILSSNIPILAVIYVMRSFFQATKQRGLANLLVMLDGVLTIVPLMYWFSHYDIYWLWAAFPISKALTVVITLIAMLISKRVQHKKNILGIEEEEGVVSDFSIKNEIPEAIRASEEAMAFCEKNGLTENTVNAVGVTVEELCHNIATYAKTNAGNSVDVCIRILSDKVNIRVRDNGTEFDPTDYIDNSGKRITGLELVRMLSSSVEYNRILGFNVTNVAIAFG